MASASGNGGRFLAAGEKGSREKGSREKGSE